MKTIKTLLLSLGVAAAMLSCDTKEKERLQSKVDSLSTELQASQQVAAQLKEVDVLIDSIDLSRNVLRANVVEGTSYNNYSDRLKDINKHIKDTQMKIDELEKTSKKVPGLSSSIRRLKSDLELRSQELAALQLEVSKMRSENESMSVAIAKKDSTLMMKEDVIKVKESDIASLETSMKDATEKNRIAMADLYYKQASALEEVADRTNFAPRKKKEALREAVELYKISLSLGKEEAQDKINTIEKELS
jgi:chromosome segregation ATPase